MTKISVKLQKKAWSNKAFYVCVKKGIYLYDAKYIAGKFPIKVNAVGQIKDTHWKPGGVVEQEVFFGTWRFKAHVYGGLQWEPGISRLLGKRSVWLVNRIYRPLGVITWRAITDWRAPGDPLHLSLLHCACKQLSVYSVTLPLAPPPFLYPNTLVNSPQGLWSTIRISLICFEISHVKQIIPL